MSVAREPWTSTAPGAKGRNLMQVPLPMMKALSEGDLASANELSPLKLSPYLISNECRSTWMRRCAQIALDPNDEAWVTRLVVCTDTGMIVGRAGFHGQPDETGMIELGYAIDPLHRRHGHARAALDILLGVAQNHPNIKKVRATVRPNNLPSMALIGQYGFQKVGEQQDEEDGTEIILELLLAVMDNAPPMFKVVPAAREDISHLAHIQTVACSPDNAFSLFFATPRQFKNSAIEMLESQFGDPTWCHVKAVEKVTGVIGGWASWNTPTDEQIRERDEKIAADIRSDSPPGLSGYVQQETDKLLAKWNKGQRYMRCKALYTDPSFRKQGIGNALVEYGNEVADREHLPILLQATPFGFPLYIKGGFETVQELDIDLREWAPDAKGNDKGYGNYRFRFMIRLPRTVLRAG